MQTTGQVCPLSMISINISRINNEASICTAEVLAIGAAIDYIWGKFWRRMHHRVAFIIAGS